MSARTDTRRSIVEAGAHLLREGGPSAMTTRGVAELAGVQAPTIYRLFGDKDGLLEAVAEHVMATFVTSKAAEMAASPDDVDPVEDMRASWWRQIDFSLANPAVFRLLSDPERVAGSPAAREGRDVLVSRVHRLAVAGLLRVPEQRAVDLIQASGVGVIHVLLATPPAQRDPALVEAMMDAVLGAILVDGSGADDVPDGSVSAAVSLRAVAPGLAVLSPPERQLLAEWLDRIVAGETSPGPQAVTSPVS